MTPAFRGPNLLGHPSPSLRRMRRMDRDKLAAHLRLLREQASHIEHRIARLERHRERAGERRRAERLERLNELHERLRSLIEEGRRLHRVRG